MHMDSDGQEEIIDFPKIEVLPDIHDEIKKFITKNGFVVPAQYDRFSVNSYQSLENVLRKLLNKGELKRQRRATMIDGKRGKIIWIYTLNEK